MSERFLEPCPCGCAFAMLHDKPRRDPISWRWVQVREIPEVARAD